jgi:molybdopterin molybdotransferase
MISVEEAIKLVLDSAQEPEIEKTPLLESLGRVLAQEICAADDIPIYDNSAMDGYAVIANDVKGADESYPVRLVIAGGSIPAGKLPQKKIDPGFCAPLMTGAAIPSGADAVVIKEDVQREGRNILVFREVMQGENIRYRGEDIKKGDIVLKSPEIIGPASIGVLASLGIGEVGTFRPPSAGVIVTGDELIEIDQKLARAKVRDSNSYALSAQIIDAGAGYNRYGIVSDDEKLIKRSIEKALRENDIITISGGTSMGEYDLVRDTLEEMGADLVFWRVNQKPGRSLTLYRLEGKPIFGLPGNPASVMVCFEMYVRPLIRKIMGFKQLFRPLVRAEALHEFRNKKGRTVFARVILESKEGRYFFSSTGIKGSGMLTSMVRANAIACFPPDMGDVRKGSIMEVYKLGCL